MAKQTVQQQKIAKEVETRLDRKLTNRQREFAKYYVEGIYSNAECARKAGFSPKVANTVAHHLLSTHKFQSIYKN